MLRNINEARLIVYLKIINFRCIIYFKYMSIFQYDSYTEALESVFKDRKKSQGQLTLAGLAQKCLMQPSYLTNVLKGRADLNSDQLYRLCELLGLNSEEQEYLNLLLELKRTQYEKRRTELKQKIKKWKVEHLRAEKNITAEKVSLTAEQTEKYYLDPYIQLVHIYLTIPKVKKTLEALAQKFSVSEARMLQVLNALEEIQYIRKKGNQYEILVNGKHLPRESPMLRPHQHMLRLKSLEQMQALTPEQVYSFSVTVSTSPEVREHLQAEFLKFIKAAEKLVKNSEPEKLYQINFDLFPWEKENF